MCGAVRVGKGVLEREVGGSKVRQSREAKREGRAMERECRKQVARAMRAAGDCIPEMLRDLAALEGDARECQALVWRSRLTSWGVPAQLIGDHMHQAAEALLDPAQLEAWGVPLHFARPLL